MIVHQAERESGTNDERGRHRGARLISVIGIVACIAMSISSCSNPTEPTASSTTTTTTATSAPAAGSALKTIDPKAFQSAVATAAEKLMVPGAMVVLHTPQGNFAADAGTT